MVVVVPIKSLDHDDINSMLRYVHSYSSTHHEVFRVNYHIIP